MDSRTALIIIGTFKQEWWGLAPVAQADFVHQVGKIMAAARLRPVTGYRLTATPGAFIETWESADPAAVERAVKDLQAMGYTHYIEARWLIGERQVEEDDEGEADTLSAETNTFAAERHPNRQDGKRKSPVRRAARPAPRRATRALERSRRRRPSTSR